MEAGPGPRRHLEMGDAGGPSETSGGNPKNQIKFCDGCPHINGRQCYCDPAFAGKMAVAVWLNTERRKKIFEKKAANSKDPDKNPKGVPNGRIQKPSDEEIKQWGEKQKARKSKGSDTKSAPCSRACGRRRPPRRSCPGRASCP